MGVYDKHAGGNVDSGSYEQNLLVASLSLTTLVLTLFVLI
ncbi:hypothetical protein VCRA2121O436_20261 [Vibrio crassostreae]|nr:hypothetical protein VCRA2121O436_20261 [Vibrio crassostreae]